MGVLLPLSWSAHHYISGILDTSNLSLMLRKSWLPVHWCWIKIWRQRLEEIEKSSFSLCQAKGKCSRLAPQQLCPPLSQEQGEVLYPHEGHASSFAKFLFFFFPLLQSLLASVNLASGLVSLKLSPMSSLKWRMLQESVGVGEYQVQNAVDMKLESN